MNKLNILSFSVFILLAGSVVIISCNKEEAPTTRVVTPVFPPAPPASFVEEFDSAGTLSAKGWVFKNNSYPIGTTGWRQGRYEAAGMAQYKFITTVPFIGFPAYSASKTPNDFISCDASTVNDASGTGNISSWLISPQVPLRNGDQIIFYTRAVDDMNYAVYTKDRMQVRVNYRDGTANVGGSPTSIGSFDSTLLDINPNYIRNDPAGNTPATPGYPRVWTKYTITLSRVPGTPGSVASARFAFRYVGTDAGLFGGMAGTNYPSVIGIDSLAFIHN